MCKRIYFSLSVNLESQKERDYLDDQRIDGRMGSEWILGRLAGGV
jgi:hypothetical protein